MKKITLFIGIMLALVLCITPVAAVSGTDFEIVIDESGKIPTYKYYNLYTPGEKYICLHTDGTHWLTSLVTFKPAKFPDAPTMVVDTSFYDKKIYLTTTVDEWEIKVYYSFSKRLHEPDPEYLDNAGVVSMRDTFYPWFIWGGELCLELSSEVSIWGVQFRPIHLYGPHS